MMRSGKKWRAYMLDDVLPNFLPCYVSKKPNQPHAKPALEEGNEKDDILIKKPTVDFI